MCYMWPFTASGCITYKGLHFYCQSHSEKESLLSESFRYKKLVAICSASGDLPWMLQRLRESKGVIWMSHEQSESY